MFMVTNRAVYPSKSGLDQIGSTLNKEGANELRLIEAHKTNDKWVIKVFALILLGIITSYSIIPAPESKPISSGIFN